MQIQADFLNALNNVNWRNPATNLSGAGFGNIASITGQPRNIQLGARILF